MMNMNKDFKQAALMVDAAAAGFRVSAPMGSEATMPGAYGNYTYPRLFVPEEVEWACAYLRERGVSFPDRAGWAPPVRVEDRDPYGDDVRAALLRFMQLPASHGMVIRVESPDRPEIVAKPGDMYLREMTRQCRYDGRELSVRALAQEIIWAHYGLHARDWNIATPLPETVITLERYAPASRDGWPYGIYGDMEEVGRASVAIACDGRDERWLRGANMFFMRLCDALHHDEPEPGARGAKLLTRDDFCEAGLGIGLDMCYDPPRPLAAARESVAP